MIPESTEPCGVLLLDKPERFTSFDVIARVRRLYGLRRVGHAGTLDPMATGLLTVLVGRAAKAAEFFADGEKRYEAHFRLGLTSDTEDVWGTIVPTGAPIPDEETVYRTAETFLGVIGQVPPMYSALKRDGQKLVDLARRGITVEREKREIRIRSLSVQRITEEEYALTVLCSKGTYIRTLCADIGAALGCGAVMSRLRRTDVGSLSLADPRCVTLERLESMTEQERLAALLSIEDAFPELPRVVLTDFFAALAKNGSEIYQKKIGTDLAENTRVLLFDGTGFFAFAEVRSFPEGSALKPVRQIRL